VARINGASEERVVVGAHYDSVWHGPGAIDNATGVEGLRRVAAHFAGTEQPRTIELVAFGAEEIGLVGARRFVADARDRNALRSIVGIVNLDCIGYGETLQLLCSPPALLTKTKEAAARLGLTDRYEVVTELGLEAGTDHLPFAQAGIPAVSILHFPYEEYHLPEDTPALVDEQRLEDAVALAIDIVQSLVDNPVLST
jgi:aminopeptidase YwaD